MISKVLIAGGALASGAVAARPSLRKLSGNNPDFKGSVTLEFSEMPPDLAVGDLRVANHALTEAVKNALESYLDQGEGADHLQNHIDAITATVSADEGDVTIQGNKITLVYTISGFSGTSAYEGAEKTAYDLIETTLDSDNEDLSVKIAELAVAPTGYEFARGLFTLSDDTLAGSVTLTFEEMPANLVGSLLGSGQTHATIGEKIATAIRKYADKESEGGALQGSFAFASGDTDQFEVTGYSVNGNDITIEFSLGDFGNDQMDADESDAYRTIRAAVSTAEAHYDYMARHDFANSVACQLVSELADEDDWSVVCEEEESSPREKTSGSARVAVVSFAAAAVAGAALF